MNVFCSDLITMVPKWNYFKFIQIYYPRWPPLLKIAKITKLTFFFNPLYFFAVWDSKMAAVTKNSAEHENDNISITA